MSNLIIYYSRTGENYVNGSIRSLPKGNTERVAEFIQRAVGGELFQIRTVKTYDADYYKCIAEAKEELHANARPELREYLTDVSGYDTIFVGYPNWWGTCPMAVFSLLERLDLPGKHIAPFCTNEGSGMGTSEKDIRRLCPGAKLKRGLSITGGEAANSEGRLKRWLSENGLR